MESSAKCAVVTFSCTPASAFHGACAVHTVGDVSVVVAVAAAAAVAASVVAVAVSEKTGEVRSVAARLAAFGAAAAPPALARLTPCASQRVSGREGARGRWLRTLALPFAPFALALALPLVFAFAAFAVCALALLNTSADQQSDQRSDQTARQTHAHTFRTGATGCAAPRWISPSSSSLLSAASSTGPV